MKRITLVIALFISISGCAGMGAKSRQPPVTEAGLAGKFNVFVGKKDEDMLQQFRDTFPLYEASTKSIRTSATGKKETAIAWSHLYVKTLSRTSYRQETVWHSSYNAITKQTSTYTTQESRPYTAYYYENYTTPCLTYFTSHNDVIESYKHEGEGCLW